MRIMKIFKRKKDKPVGRGSEKVVSFSKIFEPLNYCPLAYEYTSRFVDYISNADKDFRKRIANTSIDDLNFDLFDPSIDSNVNLEIVRAKEQYTNHVSVINHTIGLIKGAFQTANDHLINLEKDKEDAEREKEKLIKLRDALKIY